MKRRILRLLYRCGGLRFYHILRNRCTVTVVLFHRVMPFDTSAPRSEWPSFTVTPWFFEQCLEFFERYYTVIGLDRIHAAVATGAALPPRALLITFDDGWRDTVEVAAPILRQHGLPCVLFAVGGIDNGQELWQEPVMRAWLADRGEAARWRVLWATTFPNRPAPSCWSWDDFQMLLATLAEMAPGDRRRLLDHCGFDHLQPGAMLDSSNVGEFAREPFALGAHGMSHMPLTLVRDAPGELREAIKRVRGWQEKPDGNPLALSFPHGQYSADLLRAAFDVGYQYVFTSDKVLNRTVRGIPNPVLGRFEPGMDYFADTRGHLMPEVLASVLFRLPRRRLGGGL